MGCENPGSIQPGSEDVEVVLSACENPSSIQPVAYHMVNRRYSEFLNLQTRLEEKAELRKLVKGRRDGSVISVSVFKLTCENMCSLKSEIISAHHQCAQRPSYLQFGLDKCMHGLQTDLDLQLNSWPLLKRSSLVLEPTSRILL